jgi:hypothetical protein
MLRAVRKLHQGNVERLQDERTMTDSRHDEQRPGASPSLKDGMADRVVGHRRLSRVHAVGQPSHASLSASNAC